MHKKEPTPDKFRDAICNRFKQHESEPENQDSELRTQDSEDSPEDQASSSSLSASRSTLTDSTESPAPNPEDPGTTPPASHKTLTESAPGTTPSAPKSKIPRGAQAKRPLGTSLPARPLRTPPPAPNTQPAQAGKHRTRKTEETTKSTSLTISELFTNIA